MALWPLAWHPRSARIGDWWYFDTAQILGILSSLDQQVFFSFFIKIVCNTTFVQSNLFMGWEVQLRGSLESAQGIGAVRIKVWRIPPNIYLISWPCGSNIAQIRLHLLVGFLLFLRGQRYVWAQQKLSVGLRNTPLQDDVGVMVQICSTYPDLKFRSFMEGVSS